MSTSSLQLIVAFTLVLAVAGVTFGALHALLAADMEV